MPMLVARWFSVVALFALVVAPVAAQEPPKPGTEHAMLKMREGTWDTLMKADGKEFKGTMTYKMDLGGLWLAGSLESDLGGMKFSGRSLDTFDAKKGKYVGVWCDSMGTTPMIMEGTYDKEKKALIMIGDGPGMDGKMTKWKSVSTTPNADTVEMSMFVGDGKDPMFTMTYKRKK
jgi:hypothetical protein